MTSAVALLCDPLNPEDTITRLQEVLRRHPDFGRAAGALEEAKRRGARAGGAAP